MAQEEGKREGKNGGRRNDQRNYTAFDRALIAAKQTNAKVYFSMADGTEIEASIISVDKYFIEVKADYSETATTWLNKSAIMLCGVL